MQCDELLLLNDRVDRTETFQWPDAERRIRLMPLRQWLGKQGNREGTPGKEPHAIRLLPAIRFDRYICVPPKKWRHCRSKYNPMHPHGSSRVADLDHIKRLRIPTQSATRIRWIPPCGIRSIPTPYISTLIEIYPYFSCTFVAYIHLQLLRPEKRKASNIAS